MPETSKSQTRRQDQKVEASFLIIIWKFIDTADHKTKIRAPSSADLPPPEVDFYASAPPVRSMLLTCIDYNMFG